MTPAPPSLQRPRFLDPADEARYLLIETRAQILDEDWEVSAILWNQAHCGERADLIGPPDLSVNALSEICRQLSTPGLHGVRPSATNREPAADWLLEPSEGELDKAGFFSKLQQLEYYALGLGDMFAVGDVSSDGQRVVVRLVRPHHVEVEVDLEEPTRAVVLRESRRRWISGSDSWEYTWSEWDIRNPLAPTFRVLSADRLLNITPSVEPAEVLAGYRWRYADGSPFIPHEQFYWRDTGAFWHHQDMRGLTKGTLRASMYATLAGHAALSASGRAVLAAGIVPLGAQVVEVAGGTQGVTHQSVTLTPGAILYHKVEPGTQPWAMEIGPSGELKILADFSWDFQARLCQAFGINPSDAMRTTANPTSGVALSIEQRGRREFSAQIEPLWRRSTQSLIRKIAAAVRSRGGPQDLPDGNYSVTYHRIPLSPDERREEREQLASLRERELISQIEEYQTVNPGTSREAAIEALIRVRRDKVELDERFAELSGPVEDAEEIVPPQQPAPAQPQDQP